MTLQNIILTYKNIDETTLYKIYSNIQDIGNIDQIKKELPEDLFNIYLYIKLVANYKSDGWGNMLEPTNEINPYLSHLLEFFELIDMKNALEELIVLINNDFPDNYLDDIFYYWEEIEAEATQEQNKIYSAYNNLEKISTENWGLRSPNNGLKKAIAYINKCKENNFN